MKLWHRWDRNEHDYVKQMFGLGPGMPPADRPGIEVSLAPPQAVTAGQPYFSEALIRNGQGRGFDSRSRLDGPLVST